MHSEEGFEYNFSYMLWPVIMRSSSSLIHSQGFFDCDDEFLNSAVVLHIKYLPIVLTRYCKACQLLLILWHHTLHHSVVMMIAAWILLLLKRKMNYILEDYCICPGFFLVFQL